ncbi:MAG: Na/Pi cotransporter family protein [Lachnospiraceae bacterium]|nr:Na/Pi cotransporter family protein [Lachnospiraceae bacterium]MDD3615946.1 Na/Pi cotransporter family protein [Lachnospiraceae bacterium]
MDFFSLLSMIGGLALFLYGMDVMGGGLAKVSGGKLEKILESLTASPIRAVALGAAVTAVIQSSSATTVMVVGFVNSGIMKLGQAIGVIMGANIGTTITSWLLSLTGIESGNFFIQLLKPTSFSPILALIGVCCIMFSKSQKKKDIGPILVGFAVLMFGMEMMSDAVKPLADVPEFANIMTTFSNPVLGMIVGAVLTAIIQSSSASVGILQALCATGSVTFGTAIPIIMGQNIGTCVTAMLSSIGASKNAKRAAIVHLYFNIIGTITFMILFYGINLFVHFSFMGSSANAAGIAIVHSVFNVFATLLLLPFSKGLEKLAMLTIRDKEADMEVVDDDFQTLDSRFLDTPAFAIEQCRNVSIKMAEISKKALFASIKLIGNYDEKKAQRIVDMEDKVDRYEDELGSYLLKISSKNLTEEDSHTLSILLHSIGDFERISDHALNIKESAQEMFEKNLQFSKKAEDELAVFSRAIHDIVDTTYQVFATQDVQLAGTVEPLEEVIDNLQVEIRKRHVKRLRKGKCTIELGFVLSDLLTSYERVADHCSNIAVDLIQIVADEYETHSYLDSVKHEHQGAFEAAYEECKENYILP